MKRAERVMGRFACGLALFFVLGVTSGCGDDTPGAGGDPADAGVNTSDTGPAGDSTDPVDPIGNEIGESIAITHAAAKKAVEDHITKHVDGLDDALSMLEESGTVDNMLGIFEDDDSSEEGEGEMPEEGEPMPPAPPMPPEGDEGAEDGLEVDLSEMRDGILDMMADVLMVEEVSSVSADGMVLTYTLGPDQVCDNSDDDEEIGDEERASQLEDQEKCAARLAENPLHIDVTTDGDKRMNLSVKAGDDAVEVLTAQIHGDVISATVHLAELEHLIGVFVDPEDFELPATMEGVFALEIRENKAADYTARFGIVEAINIVAGADEEEPLGLQIAQSNEVGSISISGPDKTIGGALGLNALKVEMPWQWVVDMFYDTEGYSEWVCEMDDEGNENCYDMWVEGEEAPEAKGLFSVALPGIHGTLSYTLGDDAIRLSNMSLGDETAVVAVDGDAIITIDLNPEDGRAMSLDVMGEGEDDMVFQITPKLDLSLMFAWKKVSDVIEDIPSFLLDETIGINFSGSETPTMKLVNSEDSTDMMVSSGELRFTSTAMDEDVVISEGQCFVGIDDEGMSEEDEGMSEDEQDAQHDLFGGFTGGMCGGE
jgi:hypothetical protein